MDYILPLLSILSFILYIFMGVRVFRSSNFTNTQGKVFSAAFLAMILSVLLYLSLSFTTITKVREIMVQPQSSEDMVKTIEVDREIGLLSTIFKYSFFVYYGLLAAGLALQYRSTQMDRTLLALFIITLLPSLMWWGLGSWYYNINLIPNV